MSTAIAAIAKPEPDLWSALQAAAPELGMVSETLPDHQYRAWPGFREWLLTEYALNTPTRLIKSRLETIRSDQEAEGIDTPWPALSKSQLDKAAHDLAKDWQPLRHTLEANIQSVGLLGKNRRLLAYQSLAEQLHDLMFEERNDKSGELYLIKEYRQVLHAIAEEMGDLGQGSADGAVEGLIEIARAMAKSLEVHGTTIRVNDATPDYHRHIDDAEYTIIDA